jgi:hypothetical protein
MKSTMFKFVSLLFVAVILVTSLAACGGSAEQTAPEAAAPADTAAPADAAAPTPDSASSASSDVVASFKFNNTGTLDICELYLSTVDKNEWGPNQLPEGQKIAAGASFSLTNIPAGKYDAKAVGCDGTTEATIQLDIKNQ